MARRFHLFPFRTEKLSFATPMVLRTSGRVGSRRFTESLEIAISRGFFCARSLHASSGNADFPVAEGNSVGGSRMWILFWLALDAPCMFCRRDFLK